MRWLTTALRLNHFGQWFATPRPTRAIVVTSRPAARQNASLSKGPAFDREALDTHSHIESRAFTREVGPCSSVVASPEIRRLPPVGA